MNFKNPYLYISLVFAFFLTSCQYQKDSKPDENPNVVLIFLDDAAFDDFAPFGTPRYPTPHVETLAEEGKSFYNFYVPQAVCSSSRAALLTGCYPGRTKLFGALAPEDPGLSPDYATMGEVFQKNGYATACFGKWHIGDQSGRRPHDRGFDESAGLMYSNDMWHNHPENPDYWGQWPLRYWENGSVTIDPVEDEDQKMLSTWYTEKAVDFIERHSDQPFFLYLPHSMPHVPLYCSDRFEGKSGTGLYGDVMMELDWSVGQVNQAIKDQGLEENTIFVFVISDNGPWLSYGNHAGITRFREGKGTTFDGGVRNPVIIKYPGHIKPGTKSLNTFGSIDLLPTLCHLTGTPLPDNEIDGKNVWDLLLAEEEAENPHDYYPLSNNAQFQGIVSSDGKWKLFLPHSYRTLVSGGKDGIPGKYRQQEIDTTLFDLVHDPYEKSNVLHLYPEIAAEMIRMAEEHKKKFYVTENEGG